jgi:hypothetical protein
MKFYLDAGSGRVLPSDSASEAATGFQSFHASASRHQGETSSKYCDTVTVTVYPFLPTFLCIFLDATRVNLK